MSSNNALAAMVQQGRATAAEKRQADAPAQATQGNEERKPFGTKMRPSLHRFVKSQTLEMEAAVGESVRIEDLFDALLEEFKADAELRAAVAARLRGGK